jgi:hypothetical protein
MLKFRRFLLTVPRCEVSIASRGFRLAAPTIWKALPTDSVILRLFFFAVVYKYFISILPSAASECFRASASTLVDNLHVINSLRTHLTVRPQTSIH